MNIPRPSIHRPGLAAANTRTPRAFRRGALLIDAIIGAILLGISLAVILSLGGRAISSQAEGEQLRTAAMLIDERLNLILMSGVEGYTSKFDLTGTCDPPFQNFTYRVDIGGGQSGDPYTVAVTVEWSAAGRTKSETIETRIAPRLGDDPDPIRQPAQAIQRTE